MTLSTPLPRALEQMELRDPKSLQPYAGNARTHSQKQMREIADSIRRFGFVNPVLVDAEGQVIAGHGRLEAAKYLGMNEVPVLAITHLSATEQRAYILADNRLAEKAGWDKEILAIELQALIDFDFEVELTGFELAEIDLILDEDKARKSSEPEAADLVPEVSPGPPITQPGDVWKLGAHRLICGDARDPEVLAKLLGDDLSYSPILGQISGWFKLLPAPGDRFGCS